MQCLLPQRFTVVRLAILVLGGTMFAGCHVVHVEDTQGEPVPDARIITQMAAEHGGGQGPSGTTDSMGNATLQRPWMGPNPLFLEVHKVGYRSVGIEYPVIEDYTTVVLQRITSTPEP